MSLLSAAANDEDGDIIKALRAENEMLRNSLLATQATLEMTATSGAFYARTAESLRETVIRWATRAEQAEDMLEAIGAGGVGSPVARPDHAEQHLDMVPPQGWQPVPVEPTRDMLVNWIKAPVVSNTNARSLYRAMLAAAPQPPTAEESSVDHQAQLVAAKWLAEMIMSDCGCSTEYTPLLDRILGRIEAYDRANAPPTRKPLTSEQIMAAWNDAEGTRYGFGPFARAIERAHGITGETE